MFLNSTVMMYISSNIYSIATIFQVFRTCRIGNWLHASLDARWTLAGHGLTDAKTLRSMVYGHTAHNDAKLTAYLFLMNVKHCVC